ncbi:gametolysin peptidase M11 [Thermomonospora umbrina]|uniref:Gametolysin peptidase M11 n=1 Tax=Thermomonospora umbrina TaxID=111806 RepID=A0A3D9SGH1_9ACTN|nr:gametolysin peptidase M11 [Thermomonospora umbrina]
MAAAAAVAGGLVLASSPHVSAGPVSAARAPQAGPAGVQAAPTTQRIAVVMVNFADSRIDSSEAYRAKVGGMYFGTGQSTERYYREASDGTWIYAPLPGQPQVLGPFTLDMPAAPCNSGAMNTKTKEALAARGITGYDSLAIWFPNQDAKCGWGGLGQQPGSVTWMPHSGSASGVVHEIGHNLGLRHLPAVTCAPGTLTDCKDAGYRGSSPMGGGGYASGLSAPELLHRGWVPAAQQVTAPVTGTYTLTPLHAPASTAGTRVLQIPNGTDGSVITVAHRKNGTTIDAGTSIGEGVQLHLTKQGAFHTSKLVDPSAGTTGKDDTDLNAGARITTPGGITIETVSVTATAATVRVTTTTSATARYTGAGGRCLDASLATPGVVHSWDCHDGTNQQWTTGDDRTLRSQGKCLDVQGNATADGTPVIVWGCHGQPNQQWTHTGATLVSAATGKCLDAGAGGNGTQLVIRSCNGSARQNWTRS